LLHKSFARQLEEVATSVLESAGSKNNSNPKNNSSEPATRRAGSQRGHSTEDKDTDTEPARASSTTLQLAVYGASRGGRKRQRLRSRNTYIDECLQNEDGTDSFADLEDFIVA
jgi:hypothetical protein